jgi:hypothetical protein
MNGGKVTAPYTDNHYNTATVTECKRKVRHISVCKHALMLKVPDFQELTSLTFVTDSSTYITCIKAYHKARRGSAVESLLKSGVQYSCVVKQCNKPAAMR